MGQFCDFCGEQRPMIYCRSDAACLCLSCDRNVHSANALSRRHSRTLLCDECSSQPAISRCVEEKISLCHNCDWNRHGRSVSASEHKRQTINRYSGCPSASEFSRIWSFFLEIPPIEDSEQGLGLMSIDENSLSNFWSLPGNNGTVEMVGSSNDDDLANIDKFNNWVGSSSMPVQTLPSSGVHPAGSVDSTAPKLSNMDTDSLGICENDELYEEFSVEDVDLNFDNYEELFGTSRNHSEHVFDDAEIDSMFEVKNPSATNDDFQEGVLAEAAPAGQVKTQPACSNAVSADSVRSNPGSKSPKLFFSARHAHSSLSLSFSGLTGESSAGDYQDCEVSQMLLMGEPSWCPGPGTATFTSTSRESAVKRYQEKKKARKFEKKIRYESRKARADVRRRVKGRFVKAGDAYDYDPLCQTRSY